MNRKYAKYIARHKWFVFVAGLRTKAPVWRLLIHDWSKLLPCEWKPYAESFYGDAAWLRMRQKGGDDLATSAIKYLQEAKNKFDGAWLHHQHNNPHHWQHWVLREDSGATKTLKMPEHFAREMVADWMGAGRAITGKWEAAYWYLANKEKIVLHDETRQLVETLLETVKC